MFHFGLFKQPYWAKSTGSTRCIRAIFCRTNSPDTLKLVSRYSQREAFQLPGTSSLEGIVTETQLISLAMAKCTRSYWSVPTAPVLVSLKTLKFKIEN